MGRYTAFLISRFRQWERPVRVGFVLAVVLLVASMLAAAYGPPNWRQPALVGAFGLLLAAQFIFMWANRHLVTPFTQAQRLYLTEDFAGAQQILEELLAAGKADIRALTLLGNTYRQLGLLAESQEVLTKALSLDPADPFPLYGFGRTLLIRGMYAEAASVFEQALTAGAPAITTIDLGEALYRQGQFERAASVLRSYRAADEPHRVLLVDYLLYRLGEQERPARERVQAGLSFWQETAQRFQHTPYGQQLAEDVRHMQALTEET